MRKDVLLVVVATLIGCGQNDSSETAGEPKPSGQQTATNKQPNPQTQALMERATGHIQSKEYQAALQVLGQVIAADSTEASAYFERARILADARQDRLAMADFSNAIKHDPENAVYYNMRGFFLLTREMHNQAFVDFTKAIELDPKYMQAHNNRGLILLSSGHFDDAIKSFTAALEIDDSYVDAYNNRGFAYYKKEIYAEALFNFNEAVRLNPNYVNAFNNRGLVRIEKEQFDEAVDDFTSAIALDPHNSKYYLHRREALRSLERFDEADADSAKIGWLARLSELNDTVARRPNEPKGHVLRAAHLMAGGEQQAAEASYNNAVAADAQSSMAYLSRARYWFDQGDYTKTIEDCDRAIAADQAAEIEPAAEIHSLRGDANLKLENYDDAIADYQAAKRIDVTVAEAYYQRSLALRDQGMTDEADKDLHHAMTLNPEYGEPPDSGNDDEAQVDAAEPPQAVKEEEEFSPEEASSSSDSDE